MKCKLLILILVISFTPPIRAQQGLQVGELFGGRYQNNKDATEVLLTGRKISKYRLTLFRSLTIRTAAGTAEIEKRVKADAAQAIDKEVAMRRGRLYYGFYRLKPIGHTNRYLFYRNDALSPHHKANATLTLIYMEGEATINELRKIFGK